MTDGEGGFCCLGVLCVVAGVDPNSSVSSAESYTFCDKAVGGEDAGLFPSMPIQQLNDNALLTFSQIADWIEENL